MGTRIGAPLLGMHTINPCLLRDSAPFTGRLLLVCWLFLAFMQKAKSDPGTAGFVPAVAPVVMKLADARSEQRTLKLHLET